MQGITEFREEGNIRLLDFSPGDLFSSDGRKEGGEGDVEHICTETVLHFNQYIRKGGCMKKIKFGKCRT